MKIFKLNYKNVNDKFSHNKNLKIIFTKLVIFKSIFLKLKKSINMAMIKRNNYKKYPIPTIKVIRS